MLAPQKDDSIPVIGSPEDLTGVDGFLFGFLTRYGSMAAQMKPFFDSTVQLWREQKLARKTSRIFRQHRHSRRRPIDHCVNCNYSTSRYGMLFVPIGYTFGAGGEVGLARKCIESILTVKSHLLLKNENHDNRKSTKQTKSPDIFLPGRSSCQDLECMCAK
ncbi:hypothetical protein ACP275_06G127200 [Erythranthe tilingii]